VATRRSRDVAEPVGSSIEQRSRSTSKSAVSRRFVAATEKAHMRNWPAHPELGLVFTNQRNAPTQQCPFSMVFEHARAKAGPPRWAAPHDLRHFYASTLIRSGASIKVVQTRLGHSSAKTTLDV
jgi:site-specific recombinase XerD